MDVVDRDHFDKPFNSILRINFKTDAHAAIVKACLEVDEELQPKKIEKEFALESNTLIV